MDGFRHITKASEPLVELPDDWSCKRICLRFTGGIGDVLMAIGGTAKMLKSRECHVTAAVMPHIRGLAKQLIGVDDTIETTALNSPETRFSFDIVIEFKRVLNHMRSLRAEDYYKLISERVGRTVEPGQLRIEYAPEFHENAQVIALHPGASNPNRRWSEERWEELATKLVARGLFVIWLGPKDEFGFTNERMFKASDKSDCLVDQSKLLASSHFFIGNDSGFCHVAGLLGVPGCVIFSATHPDTVIKHYPLLTGVHAFDKLGIEPTRSLDVKDSVSLWAADSVLVDEVLNSTPYGDWPEVVKPPSGERHATRHTLLALEPTTLKAASYLDDLEEFFGIHRFPTLPDDWSGFDAVVTVDVPNTTLFNGEPWKPNVYLSTAQPIEVARRMIREVINSEDVQ